MKELIKEILKSKTNKRFNTLDLEREVKLEFNRGDKLFSYRDFTKVILDLEYENFIKKIKSSKQTTSNPLLFSKYQLVVEKKKINKQLLELLLANVHPRIDTAIYFKDEELLKKDLIYIEEISKYLSNKNSIYQDISVNERSYELFGDEKFLGSNRGKGLLKRLSLTLKDLHCYETFEPFFYYQRSNVPVNGVLIVENKDTFFSIKKLLNEGVNIWSGIPISLLIYGEGNKITKSIHFIEEIGVGEEVPIYYYGDLDPEGIAIYYRTKERTSRKISPFVPLYKELWEYKRTNRKWDNQSWNSTAINDFFSFFDDQWTGEVNNFLHQKGCVPQEALSIETMRGMAYGIAKSV